MSKPSSDGASPTDVPRLLAENHQRFLAFLSPRLGTPEEAEELLQSAFVKGLERADSVREGESAVAWFYRLLRNALIDHYRHRGASRRALDKLAADATLEADIPEELEATVCACVAGLTGTLKSEYAEALRAVDLGGEAVGDFAHRMKLRPNTAAVRLHRARAALGRRLVEMCGTCCQHGCRDCECANAGSSVPKGEDEPPAG